MNPSAREALEAERKECGDCYQGHGAFLKEMYLCPVHRDVLRGIELAERADLERECPTNHEALWETNWMDDEGVTLKVNFCPSCGAAFPEVKEGE